jgi:hypothetical protein
MGPTTIVFGVVLIAIGCNGYLNTDPEKASITALIPAFVGGLLVLLGALALKDSLRKHAMHGAAMVGLLGFLAAAGRLTQKLIAEGNLGVSSATIHVGLMALVCAVFVGLCVKSFIDARRRRQASA